MAAQVSLSHWYHFGTFVLFSQLPDSFIPKVGVCLRRAGLSLDRLSCASSVLVLHNALESKMAGPVHGSEKQRKPMPTPIVGVMKINESVFDSSDAIRKRGKSKNDSIFSEGL